LLFMILKFIAIPYKQLLFYKRQGFPMKFFPIVGMFGQNYKRVQTHGDFYWDFKVAIKENPNNRGIATNIANYSLLLVSDPTLIKEYYANSEKYKKSSQVIDYFMPLLGDGLISSEGETWKKHRKLISSMFHFEFLKSKIPLMIETTKEFHDKMEEGDMKRVDIMTEFQKITGEVVGRIFFGKNLNKYQMDGQPLTIVLAELNADIAMVGRKPLRMLLGDWLYNKTPELKSLITRIQKFRAVCNEIVTDRRTSRKSDQIANKITHEKDLLDLLLDAQQNNVEDAMSDEEIIDEFASFFMAGMDTTGHLTTMMTYNLCTHPQLIDTLREEINSHYKGKDLSLTVEDLNSMSLLNLVVKETLRFNSPSNGIFFRETLIDHRLGDIMMKKGTLFGTQVMANNFNPKNYEDPEKFDPYRWSEERNKNLRPYAYVPFSAGSRNCIGQHMSQIEAKIIMSEFLQRYECKISDGYVHKMTTRFVYEPHNTLYVDLKKRSS